MEERREKYLKMGIPEYAIPKGKKLDTTKANGLTDVVIQFIKGKGGAAYRCSVQGQYDPRIGKFRTGGMKKGLPDIIGMLPNGRFLGVEIKIGKDKQSQDQQERQREIENAAGVYLLVSSYDSFLLQYNQIINT